MSNEGHVDVVNENYLVNKDFYREEFKSEILNRRVVKGMWPTEAMLAGGAAIYKVKADEKVWPSGSDPFNVMRAQCFNPDDSGIEMSFNNCHQFESLIPCRFVVVFKNGIVAEIKEK